MPFVRLSADSAQLLLADTIFSQSTNTVLCCLFWNNSLALATTPAGSSVCIALLDRLDGFLESSEGSPEAAAFDIG